MLHNRVNHVLNRNLFSDMTFRGKASVGICLLGFWLSIHLISNRSRHQKIRFVPFELNSVYIWHSLYVLWGSVSDSRIFILICFLIFLKVFWLTSWMIYRDQLRTFATMSVFSIKCEIKWIKNCALFAMWPTYPFLNWLSGLARGQ